MLNEFSTLKEGTIYLDSAATTLKPTSVHDAVLAYYKDECATVHRSVYESGARVSKQYEDVRGQVKEFIEASDSDEIIFTKSATEGLNLLAYSLSTYCLEKGDEVIVSVSEHHSNFVPWQEACKRVGARFIVVGLNDQLQINLEELKEKISSRTKIVAVNHISNVLGVQNPIEQIAKICKTSGVYLVVDGAQSVSHEKIEVQKLGADFFVFSGHKMYGPTGVGVLWGRKNLLEKMPPFLFGGSMVDEVLEDRTSYQPLPQKFEAGTPPIASVLGLGKAIEFIEKNRLRIKEQKELVTFTKHELKRCLGDKVTIISGQNMILSFVINGIHSLDLATLLALEGISVRVGHHCSAPLLQYLNHSSVVRISIGVYNTKQEIQKSVTAIERLALEVECKISSE